MELQPFSITLLSALLCNMFFYLCSLLWLRLPSEHSRVSCHVDVAAGSNKFTLPHPQQVQFASPPNKKFQLTTGLVLPNKNLAG